MRVVVVGAGVGGLACAARLAAKGHEVTVLEQSDVVGGKVRRHEENGFRFDTGPSLLTLPRVFADLFAATGSTLEDELTLVPLDPVVRHVFADGTVLDSSADRDEFTARIANVLGPRAGADWRRLWRRAERAWDASWRHILRSPVDSPVALARLAWRVRALAAIGPGRTLRGLGRSYLSDGRLRTLLERYATYAGSDPRRAPAALVAVPYAELTFGGWYVRGGLATLADALARRCEALGVTIHTGVTVSGVDSVAADAVVSNAPVHGGPSSLSAFVLLLGVRGRTPGLAHHTVFFPADYDAEFDAIFASPARPVPDPAIYVTVPDDPTVRPDGHEAWTILVNAAPHGRTPSTVDWTTPGLAESYADHVLAVLATRGLDVRDRVLFRVVRTPADLEAETQTPGGAIYGTPRHGLTGLLRPPNRGPVRGHYRVGGTTHPGGGLPMVALSAEIVSALIDPTPRSTQLP